MLHITKSFTKTNFNDTYCENFQKAVYFFDKTREINIYTTIFVILIGLIGNILAIIVFIQKRFRKTSAEVFLLVLAISDGLFLLTHFFEDTLRTIIDFYVRNNKTIMSYSECNNMNISNASYVKSLDYSIFTAINIVDKFEFSCRFVNFLRNFLRFISAYLITIFTIHRLIGQNFKSYKRILTTTKAAWKTVFCLVLIAVILCSFSPYLFTLNEDETNFESIVHCDADRKKGHLYFITIIIYVIFVMFIPIATIIICNTLIIIQVYRARKQRKCLFAHDLNRKIKIEIHKNNDLDELKSFQDESIDICFVEPKTRLESNQLSNTRLVVPKLGTCNPCTTVRNNSFLEKLTVSQRRKFSKFKRFQISSQRVARILAIMSLSYAILNLPYFVTWCIFYYNIEIEKKNTSIQKQYLFGFINIAEIFYVLNYGLHFFLYCASSKRFLKQLSISFRKSSKKNSYFKHKFLT